ncbi:MAG TPA: hypothetical protein VFA43_02195 [Gemmatimonadaceae bacterium]|nr:hypothetical protein [Gemmatimonadaceae bacterium]
MRYLAFVVALAAAPLVLHAQDTTHKDTTHHDSSAVNRKANHTVNNAGEGVKQANDQVDNGAYKVGTDVKNLFRGKPKKKPAPKPDSAAIRDSTRRDSTPH